MNFASRALVILEHHAEHRTDTRRISWQSLQPYPQPGYGANIVIEPGCSAILSNHQVHAPIFIIIAECCAALFAKNSDARTHTRNRCELAASVTLEPQAQPCVDAC